MTESFLTERESPHNSYLVGVCHRPSGSKLETDANLDELDGLAKTVGGRVVGRSVFNVKRPNPATYIGPGQAESLRESIDKMGITRFIFDEELTPGQQRNLANHLRVEVIDRTELILELFSLHARSYESRVQVELARLEYLLPRLRGRWSHLERQFGRGRIRGGPGEKQIELDRRMIIDRISRLKKRLKKIVRVRSTQKRSRADKVRIAIAGYTNAGKSTLFNRLVRAETLVQDKLFATLDATTRRFRLRDGREVLLSDTVGFIRKLPHRLIESFKSTLEVVTDSDLIIHLIDASSPEMETEIATVEEILDELGASDIPRVDVYNKSDKLSSHGGPDRGGNRIFISAKTGRGIARLEQILIDEISGVREGWVTRGQVLS